jgi:hypothetical protein
MRFNHMELTLPRGTLTPEYRAEIDAFYGDVFGWTFLDTPIVGQLGHLCRIDEDDFILLLESDTPMSSLGYDHLGILLPTREEVDDTLAKIKTWQAKDDRIRIKEYTDLHTGNVIVHAFYVRHLLPIWFDIQVIERVNA